MKRTWFSFTAILLAAPLMCFAAETQLRMGTVNVGGTYYLTGTAYAQTIGKYQPDIKINVEVTGGSVDNLKLLTNGEIDMGFAIAPMIKLATEGAAPFRKPVELRALTAVNLGRQHIVVRKGAGIKTINDLKGKRVSTGEPGNSSEIIAIATLGVVGIDVNKDITRQRTNLSDSMDAIADGRCDAIFYTAGVGIPSVREATTTSDKAELIGLDDELIKKVISKYNYFVKTDIPQGAYGNAQALPTIGAANVLFSKVALPDDVAYKIVSTMYEHRDEWVKAHVSAQEQTLQFGVQGSPIPFHPGAVRYYQEKGLAVK